jgi:hypothetical protein
MYHFTGKFGNLKELGFSFHKLFGNDRKVYFKDGVWLWVKKRNIRIDDCPEKMQSIFIDAVVNNLISTEDVYLFDIKKKCIILFSDYVTDMMSKGLNPVSDRDWKRFKEYLLSKETKETIKYLYNNNLIKKE